ncbi:Trk system potassium transporter TrkA [Thiorhodospira sibirica]|uniref:Trk system potassium transporter TrkA n=1 Tax=Thiorhodospira sibirica TaxID=154347 RepID=UPI00022C1CE9|nr:Trk system potassium transporter TrkA [Thiorhodospira sibirica]
MKIIILGAGQVGSSVAQSLASEANDITIVDTRAEILRELQDRLDLRTITGMAAHPDVLEAAGGRDADMIIAVTNSDETNMIACQVAYTLFRTPTKIARVRAREYLRHKELFSQGALPVDVLISPEELVTNYVQRLIEHPGALQVLDFADGLVSLAAVQAHRGGALIGNELRNLRMHMPGVKARVVAIFRNEEAIFPQSNTVIEPGDEVFFIAAKKNIRAVTSELRTPDRPYRRVIIAGGGNIGKHLAENLSEHCNVKLIEQDPKRAKYLAETLDNVVVLRGDAADEDLLLEENIEHTDVFCAVTNDDEVNILSAMLAKRLKTRRVMALINRLSYVDLVQSGNVDIAISPQQITIGALLTHIRRGDVVAVHSLRRGAAEAIEAVAHGDPITSKVVGRRIDQIRLPKGCIIGAIVRGQEIIIAQADSRIDAEDHLILFLSDKRRVHEVERLFQVSVTFL